MNYELLANEFQFHKPKAVDRSLLTIDFFC